MNFTNNRNGNYLRNVERSYGRLVSLTFLQNLKAKKPYVRIRHQRYHVKQIMKTVLVNIDPSDIATGHWPPQGINNIIDNAVNDYIDMQFP